MPIRSMTGFGAAEGPVAGGRLRVEVRSVNHRHLNVQLKAPAEIASLEADVRACLRERMSRGSVTVTVRWLEPPAQAAGAAVDSERARALVTVLRALGRELGLSGDVDLATLARLPMVVRTDVAEAPVVAPEVMEVVRSAVAACVAMREREGQALAADIVSRLHRVASLSERIAERAPSRLLAERDRLASAVRELAGGVSLDSARLAQEIALFADRLDITEELVRLRSHLAAMRASVGDSRDATGRELAFLVQELGREANTIGSKANDAPIAEAVIAIKSELERVREQVENLE
jgi:uncharacterized protein (TIGR00255 family)